MIIEVQAGEFKKKIARSFGVVQAKAIMPALSRIKLEVLGGGAAVMSATDLTSSVIQTTKVNLKSDGVGSMLLPGRQVNEIVSNLKADDVLTITTDDTNTILLKAKGFKAKLTGMPVEQFPAIEPKPATKFNVNRAALISVISKVEAAAPSKAGRHSVPSVLVESSAAGLRAAASDGFRIAIADVPGASAGEFSIQLQKTVLSLIKEIPDVGGVIELTDSETNFFFSAGEEQVLIRKAMTKFPPYQKALGLSNFKTAFKLSVAVFKEALERVHPTVDGKVPSVIITAAGNEILFTSTSEDGSNAEAAYEAGVTGIPNAIKVNPAFLSDFLGQADADVTVEIVNGTSLAKFTSGPTYIYLVMPLLPDQPKEAPAK